MIKKMFVLKENFFSSEFLLHKKNFSLSHKVIRHFTNTYVCVLQRKHKEERKKRVGMKGSTPGEIKEFFLRDKRLSKAFRHTLRLSEMRKYLNFHLIIISLLNSGDVYGKMN